ncbi:MAG: glycosyltransferase [Paludibacter sp.]
MPKLTVALITYNRTKYLKEAIEGILLQSFRDFELFIMDNGSTPETYELIKPYLNNQVSYHRNTVNRRDYLNYPFEIANGEYLIITHDDDIMLENMLENQVAILDRNPDISIVGTNTIHIDENSKIIKRKGQKIKKDIIWSKYEFIRDSINNDIHIPCPTVMFRKKIFNQYNLRFNLNVGPATDLYLWYETNLLDYKMYFLSEPLYKYRLHNKQDSTVSKIEMEFSIYTPIIDLLAKNKLTNLIPKAKKRRNSIIFDSIINSYYHHNINFDEMKSLLSRLTKLKFRLSINSIRSITKLAIRMIKF